MPEYEYAFLAVTRVRTEFIALTDGTELALDARGPQSALAAYFNDRVVPEVQRRDEAADTDWRRGLDEFAAQVQVEHRTVKTGVMGPSEDRVSLVFPDGYDTEVYPEEINEEIARRYSLRDRKPSPRSLAFEQWASEAGATTRWRVEWHATLYMDGGAREVKLETPRGWQYGAPLDAIVGLLNELGRRRWQLVTIDEDKGIYAGIESANSAAPVRIRYTFSRERL
jgi:hypothetical protein